MKNTGYQGLMLKVTLLLDSSVFFIAMAVISTAQGFITMQFPNASTSHVGMVISITALFMFPTLLLSGKLCQYLSKKTLLIFGILMYSISGCLIAFMNDLNLIIMMRAVMGIGLGFSQPIIPTLIVKYYDGKERHNMMGWGVSISNLVGIFSAILAGIIATVNWHYSFFIFGSGIVMAIMAYIYVPYEAPEKKDMEEIVKQEGKLPPFGIGMIYISLIWFCICLFSGVFAVKMGYILLFEKLGTATQVGLLMAVYQIGAFVIGWFFSNLYKVLYRYALLLCLILYGLGFYVFGTAKSFELLAVGAFIIGFAMSIGAVYCKVRIGELVPQVRMSMAMATIGAIGFLGQFFTSFWAQLMEIIAGNNDPRTAVMGSCIAFMVAALAVLIFILVTDKSPNFNIRERQDEKLQQSSV